MFRGVPQICTDQRAAAVDIGFLHFHDNHGAGLLALHFELRGERGVPADNRFAVHAERFVHAGDQKQQADRRIADDVPQRVEAVIAAAVGYEQSVVVDDFHEAGHVAARRVVGGAIGLGADDDHG